MTFLEKLQSSTVILDGAMGTALIGHLAAGARPEELNLTRPQLVESVHRAYIEAGSHVIYTNTFGSNPLKTESYKEEIIAGVKCAQRAICGGQCKFIALDVGPTGKMIKPLGTLDFEDAVTAFKAEIAAGVEAGVDLIAIETMSDPYEMKAAVIAAKECCDLPIIATMVFGEDEKTLTGCSPEASVAIAEGLGVCAVGVNCSLAPAQMTAVVKRMLAVASVPVVVKPNAGLPEEKNGRAVYSLSPEKFGEDMGALVELGVRVIGGCCGTTPQHIARLKQFSGKFTPIENKQITVVSAYTDALELGGMPVLIGERLNPTGKKRLKEALRENDLPYVLSEAVRQAENGAHALDVNVGLPGLDEAAVLKNCIAEIQAVTDLPLQIDTSDPVAMERAMRVYNGKPLVNSVNGKRESMEAVFPLVKKYGGAVVCLTLDENGIPPTAEGRVAVAENILKTAKDYGIERKNLIFDTLATAVSADPQAANASIGALRIIKEKLYCPVSLGVSNVSFGLPHREFITSAYFTLALGAGLSAAICDPCSEDIKRAYYSYLSLSGQDAACEKYIDFASTIESVSVTHSQKTSGEKSANGLAYFIKKGLKSEAAECAKRLLQTAEATDIINAEIIPALDEVGVGFENKTVFLPQLLMSAEAAGAAFEVLRAAAKSVGGAKRTVFVTATVKGDVHDMGKNIVVMLLKNYGFTVHDLGRDVAPERVVEAALKFNADAVGLSALMTTTVPAMKETVALLKKTCPNVKTCVGGAVLTPEYAAIIGADRYCKDAMDTVRFAEQIEKTKL